MTDYDLENHQLGCSMIYGVLPCVCEELEAAYQRGFSDGKSSINVGVRNP